MKYRSPVSQMLHEHANDLFNVGFIDKATMQRFDKSCLTEVKPLSPDEIKAIRESSQTSQAVFANYLNISKNLVSEWERGVRKPSGAALKLLTLVQKKGLEAIA